MDCTSVRHDSDLIDRARVLRHTTLAARERAARVRAHSRALRRGVAHHEARDGVDVRLATQVDRYALVEVAGFVDMAARDEFAAVLGRAVAGGAPALIVDLDRVRLLAAAGLHCLERAAARLAEHGGRLHLACSPRSPAARFLGLLEPDADWSVHADVTTAVAAVTGRP